MKYLYHCNINKPAKLGTIKHQTLVITTLSFLGAFIGFIITGLLFPNYLTPGQNGIIKLLLSYSLLLGQFANLGFTNVTTRLFPYFRNNNNHHNGYIRVLTVVTTCGALISTLIFLGLYFTGHFQKAESDTLSFYQYALYLIPLTWITTFFFAYDNYLKVSYQAVIGSFQKDVLQRILILASITLFITHIITFQQFILAYLFAYATPTLVLTLHIIKQGDFKVPVTPSVFRRRMRLAMIDVSLFGLIVGFSNLVVLNIDAIMISRFLDLDQTGIYGITFFFGTLIIIPARALRKTASTPLAEAWRIKDISLIQSIYTKSSINQFLIGALLFIGIWGNLHNIFQLLPAQYQAGQYVILFAGLANLTEMASGVAGTIINTSRHYRYMAWFFVVLIVVTIVSNLIFIPRWGITGAAVASFFSMSIFLILRAALLWNKHHIQPFRTNHLKIIVAATLSLLISYTLPHLPLYFDILLRSGIIATVYAVLNLLFKSSEDYTTLAKQLSQRILKK